jgi:hypothetical protein
MAQLSNATRSSHGSEAGASLTGLAVVFIATATSALAFLWSLVELAQWLFQVNILASSGVSGATILVLLSLVAALSHVLVRTMLATYGPAIETELRIFADSESPAFYEFCRERVLRAQRVVLIGAGLNILHRDAFTKELLQRAKDGYCQLEIFLADPSSPAVEVRLIEEEIDGRPAPVGAPGLRRRIDNLLSIWRDLGRPDSIKIGLLTHYPTFAMLIADCDYLFYPYGFATLGNFSPVLRFSTTEHSHRPVIAFLDGQYNRVRSSAVDAGVAFAIRHMDYTDVGNLRAFALYFVPPAGSGLYNFGSSVLGYDVRTTHHISSRWQNMVGSAAAFGFHVTLCDALYFLNQSEIRSIVSEVKFLAREFAPFDLTELQLRQSFPDAASIAITMKDRSGTMEALHHELVHRVYRRAVGSYYSLGLTPLRRDADAERADLMMRRYRSPYILQRFIPHFTLLGDVSTEEQSRVSAELEALFSQEVGERVIHVDKLAVMTRHPDGQWVIESEIVLG